MNCFDLSRDEAGVSMKQAQRLATGEGIKHEKLEEIARKVLNSLYLHVAQDKGSNVGDVFSQWRAKGGIEQFLPTGRRGKIILNRDQFLRDGLELFIRMNDLNVIFPKMDKSKASLMAWLIHFCFLILLPPMWIMF